MCIAKPHYFVLGKGKAKGQLLAAYIISCASYAQFADGLNNLNKCTWNQGVVIMCSQFPSPCSVRRYVKYLSEE